jgi:hypothetical protein
MLVLAAAASAHPPAPDFDQRLLSDRNLVASLHDARSATETYSNGTQKSTPANSQRNLEVSVRVPVTDRIHPCKFSAEPGAFYTSTRLTRVRDVQIGRGNLMLMEIKCFLSDGVGSGGSLRYLLEDRAATL